MYNVSFRKANCRYILKINQCIITLSFLHNNVLTYRPILSRRRLRSTFAKCFSGHSMHHTTTFKRDAKSPLPQFLMSCKESYPNSVIEDFLLSTFLNFFELNKVRDINN
jgi:hypothetical protein